MTDKTIINGVDVSGCFHLYPTRECDLNRHYPGFPKYCHEYPACYFKQSARKDERIRGLEQKLSQIAEEIEEYREDCIDYEGDDTEGYCYGCQSVYCLAKQIKQIAQEKNIS